MDNPQNAGLTTPKWAHDQQCVERWDDRGTTPEVAGCRTPLHHGFIHYPQIWQATGEKKTGQEPNSILAFRTCLAAPIWSPDFVG